MGWGRGRVLTAGILATSPGYPAHHMPVDGGLRGADSMAVISGADGSSCRFVGKPVGDLETDLEMGNAQPH